jgi:hypothetical protein
MKSYTTLGLAGVFLLLSAFVQPTDYIYLQNPSFEGDEPQDATVPASWHPCQEGTTPDILPGVWGVYLEPADGETFVGLITRSDGTWESIGQRLSGPLQPKECYNFQIDLATATTYAGYNQPVKLRVWGGASKCSADQLLAETNYIDHADWETYKLMLIPKTTIHYLILEAYHGSPDDTQRKGNVILDNIQPIQKCIRASLPMQDDVPRG